MADLYVDGKPTTWAEYRAWQEGWQKGQKDAKAVEFVDLENFTTPHPDHTDYDRGFRDGAESVRRELRILIGVTDFSGSDVT